MSDKQTYKEYQAEIKAEQGSLTREKIVDIMNKRNEFMLDLDNLRPQEHRWIDRGMVMSCEGAGHPNHRSYKRR